MLTKIRVENYKGFREAEIPIKPITVLLGANSSGKSSMLQLLLLLQQTAEETSVSYKSALKIFGNRISVGKVENLFYGLNGKKPISIQIDFINELLKSYLADAVSSYLAHSMMFYKKGSETNNRSEVEMYFNKVLNNTDNSFIEAYAFLSDFISTEDVKYKNIQSLMLNYDFLNNLHDNVKATTFSFSYTISYFRKQLVVSAFSFKNENISILSYNESDGFSSDMIDLNDTDKASLNVAFLKDSTIFNIFSKRENHRRSHNGIETSLSKTMINIINKGLSILQNEFKEPLINHVGPLRAHPQRYYMLDKANVTYSLDTYDANAIAEVIKDKQALKDRVNKWFEQFGLEVTVEEFKEAVHKLTVRQSNLPLDIPDVGFGVSQVLPVVMQGFLSPNKSVTIVEQPEVHLHPKMQASLADLFIDITKEAKYSKHLLIETHSEYLLKRLRRRMAEGEDISPDNVSINLFHSRTEKKPAIIENLLIEDRGYFDWPEEYYDGELSNDTNVFLKLQADGDIYSDN